MGNEPFGVKSAALFYMFKKISLFDNTLIEQSNPLYDIISELKKGDKVKVSGSFLKSIDNDYIYEISLTENGSMQKPDFVVKFESIEKQ